MNEEGVVFFKTLLDQAKRKQDLLSLLPSSLKEKISLSFIPAKKIREGISSPKEQIHKIHGTWLAKIFKTNPHASFFYSLLSEEQKKQIAPLSSYPLRKLPTLFFSKFLLSELNSQTIPEEFLPQSPFNTLLSFSFENLDLLISNLGIYDLNQEIKKIIDPLILKRLDRALTPFQRNWLKQLIGKNIFNNIGPTHLEGWKGSTLELQELLIKRGLFRLARSLDEEHADLAVHLAMRLELRKGEVLKRYCQKKESMKNDLFKMQTLELMEYIKEGDVT